MTEKAEDGAFVYVSFSTELFSHIVSKFHKLAKCNKFQECGIICVRLYSISKIKNLLKYYIFLNLYFV